MANFTLKHLLGATSGAAAGPRRRTEVENKTFADIQIGDTASLTRVLRPEDVESWAAVTGNPNLLAAEGERAAPGAFSRAGGGAVWAAALVSEIIGTRIPGPGSSTRSVYFDFAGPVPVGTPITATATVKEKNAASGTVGLDCLCVDSTGRDVLLAAVIVVAPTENLRAPLRALPKVQLRREDRYLELIARCEGLEPMSTAVVHPCSEDALVGAIQAAEHKLIKPILVGPEAKSAPLRNRQRSTSRRSESLRRTTAITPLCSRSNWCAPARRPI